METYLETLLTIYSIVRFEKAPHTYLCTPHEIILRHKQDWEIIKKHLEQLEKEELIITKKLDKVAVCITAEGVTKAKALKNNFVADSFSFTNEKKQLPLDKLAS